MKDWIAVIVSCVVGLAGILLCLFGPQVFTSSGRSQLGAWGKPAHVTLYNGGKPVCEWDSVGKVLAEKDSDGWFFQDAKTGSLIRLSGSVVVESK